MLATSFENREIAGQLLAKKLSVYKNTNSTILAIPRGGVAVAVPMAKNLNLPLDIVLSKKIGHPQNSEYAIGSVTLDDVTINEHEDVTKEYIDNQIAKVREVLKERYRNYEQYRPTDREIKGKIVIIVDDGIATGNTILATIKMLRKNNAKKIVIAVPVIPNDKITQFTKEADELIYILAPDYFPGVGAFYDDFSQVSDKEAIEMLKEINTKPVNLK